jgi:hypothetical protein
MYLNHPRPSSQARFEVRRLNAAHSAADGTVSVVLGRCDISNQGLAGSLAPPASRQWQLLRPPGTAPSVRWLAS